MMPVRFCDHWVAVSDFIKEMDESGFEPSV
jgi:hypothetical protein